MIDKKKLLTNLDLIEGTMARPDLTDDLIDVCLAFYATLGDAIRAGYYDYTVVEGTDLDMHAEDEGGSLPYIGGIHT